MGLTVAEIELRARCCAVRPEDAAVELHTRPGERLQPGAYTD